jgi:predicted AlkP superfamily pyrophosphatase or phosphodiesterase
VALLAGGLLVMRAQAPNPSPARPKLIVVIVVDQMRADYVERFRNRWHSGLRRLVDQGAWLRNAAYPYSETETCPGHATVSTGAFPSTHGIVGNTWWDRQTTAVVTCTQDASVRRVGMSGATTAAGDSAARLLAPSFAEQLRRAVPGSRVVTMSVKARSSIMLAGHQADASLWLDESTGELLTSTAYGTELPAFARQFVAAHPIAGDFSQVWQLAAPAASYAGGRSVAGEGPPSGWTTSFPHPLAAGDSAPGTAFVQRWRTSPFVDVYLERLAAAAIDDLKLGSGPGVDFLGIGFSATDYIGHSFGPDSREIEDDMLVLDKTVGALLDKLDRSVGAGKYVVALTADHGVAPIPEQAKEKGRDAGRASTGDVVAAIEKVLDEKLGEGRYVAQFIPPDLYLAPGVVDRLDAQPILWRDLQQAVLSEPNVRSMWVRTGRRTLPDMSWNGPSQERSGDLWIGLKAYWIFSARVGNGWAGGTTHGSAYGYDQDIPIILFGAGIKRGRYTIPDNNPTAPYQPSPADIAPTLASLAGVSIGKTDGRILREVLSKPPR